MYTTLCEGCEYQNEEDKVLVLREHADLWKRQIHKKLGHHEMKVSGDGHKRAWKHQEPPVL